MQWKLRRQVDRIGEGPSYIVQIFKSLEDSLLEEVNVELLSHHHRLVLCQLRHPYAKPFRRMIIDKKFSFFFILHFSYRK